MSEADEIHLPRSLLIKISMWIETLHLSASLPVSISLSVSVVRIPTVCRSQSTLSPQAPVPYKLEYLYLFFWSIDHHFVRQREGILLDFIVVL